MADYQSTYTGAQIDAAVGAVSGKADKVSSPTSGNFAALDSNGNLTDSGHKHSDYLTSFTETDPVFSASAAHGISSSDISNWNSKTSNTGTITSVKMNGSTVASSGEADLGTVITSETALSKGTTTGSGNAVTDLSVSGHQITLTKGSTFLTSETDPVFTASAAHGITSSDITSWNGKADKISIVSHGTSDTTFTLTPNVFHTWGTVTSLTLTLGTGTSYLDEYMFEFTSGSTATTLSLPNAVSWINGTPTIATNTTYQVSIVNNIAVIGGTA